MAAKYRLTAADRGEIIGNAIRHGFDKRQKALDAEENAIGLAAIAMIVPEAERKLAKKLGEKWIVRTQKPIFTWAGGQRDGVYLKEPALVPRAGDNGWSPLGTIVDPDLNDRRDKLNMAKKELAEEIGKTTRTLEELLRRAVTYKLLVSTWPEGKPFYERFEALEPAALPAVQVSALNQVLGLPIAA